MDDSTAGTVDGVRSPQSSAAAVRAVLRDRRVLVTMSRPVIDVRIEVDQIPAPGAKTLVRSSTTVAGGTDGNIAAGLGHLGVGVVVTGSASSDPRAAADRDSLRAHGVDVRWDEASAGPAVVCHVLVDPDGERAILVDVADDDDRVTEGMVRSTTAAVTDQTWDAAYLGVLRPVHLRLAPLVRPRARLVVVTLEAGEPPGPWLADVAGAVDVVLLTEEAFDADRERLLGLGRRHGWSLVVTAGVRGCTLVRPDGTTRTRPAATLRGPVVDTTGAGDAFAAGLLAALLTGLDSNRALDPAAWYAARAVEGAGPRAFADPEEFGTVLATGDPGDGKV